MATDKVFKNALVRWVFPALFLLFFLIASLRGIFKYLPNPEWVAIAFVGVGLAAFCCLLALNVVRDTFVRLASWPIVSYLAIVLWAVVSYVIYPIADARKLIGKGSTADDAVIVSAQSFLQGNGMYAGVLYDGAPISPGPGWVLLNLPIASHALFWLITPLYALIALLVWRKANLPAAGVGISLLLLSGSLLFWDLLVTGHDIPAMGFMLVILTVMANQYLNCRQVRWQYFMALGLLCGFFATSRVVFFGMPILLGGFIWKWNKTAGLVFALTGMLVTSGLHLAFLLTSDVYQPLHLFQRGESQMGVGLMVLGLLAAALIYGLAYWGLTRSVTSWLASLGFVIGVPLAFVAFGELRAGNWELSLWEGANYLFPAAPLLSFWIGLSLIEQHGSIAPFAEKETIGLCPRQNP